MNFMGSTHSPESTYFDEKLERARIKLKEFPALQKVINNFNSANRENHDKNAILNILSMFDAGFMSQETISRYDAILKDLDKLLGSLLVILPKEKKNNLITRINLFGKENFELMNELEFYVELNNNKKVSQISYENLKKGNQDFNLNILGEEFNIEVTSLGKGQIQKIVEMAFELASKEIFSKIPKKIYLQIEVVTDGLLNEGKNSSIEIKNKIMEDYEKMKEIVWINPDGLCIIEKNLGNPSKSLYDIKDMFEYYQEFGQRLSRLASNTSGVSYLKNTKIKDITNSSVYSFIVGGAKFGSVIVQSQCLCPSRSEDLRKKSLVNQLKRRIKDKILSRQLKGKKNPLIALRFEDFSFMHYSSDSDIWWEENAKDLKEIVNSIFTETGDNEILGVLLYEDTLKKSRFFQNPNISVSKDLQDKIEVLKI